MLVTQQETMRLIRKLIFAKYSQDPTHFCRCVDEIAQTLDEQGDKDIALWHARNDNPQMRVRHILEYIENGEMVGKDVLEYDASTDKWHRIEVESIELVLGHYITHAHLTPFCWRSEDEIKYTNRDFYQQPLAHLCELHTI